MPSFKKHYDYVIIGAGSGGLMAATGLKKIGKDVLIIGKDIGGECTHTGCIPSKTFLSLAMHYVWKSHKQCNLELREGIFDMIRDKVKELEKKDKGRLDDSDVPFLHGKARFINEETVEVETLGKDKRTLKIKFDQCVISTGSRAQTVHVEGLPKEKILTNETLFKLKELPQRMVIFGGGPIGTENGTAFAKFCTHTSIIVRSEMIPTEPRECVYVVKKSLTEEFEAKIYENAKETIYDTETGHITLKDKDGKEIDKVLKADYYLMALGRLPNVEELSLENANIKYDKKGVIVDHNLRTTNRNVYAIGDVIDAPRFAHLSANHAKFVIKKALVPWAQRDESPLPAVTYSDPPIASVGDKEETELVKKFVIDFGKSDRGRVENAEGLIGCIYVEMFTGKIKGASLVGHFAEHVINFFTLAITKNMSVFELENFMVPYPTYFNGIEMLYYKFLDEYKKNWHIYFFAWLKFYSWNILAIVCMIALSIILLWS
jgi:pyruvate/2-oxoglutarate dehydrogenase complex dihydrolipoamide dehydrogenase (E3) component